MDVFHKLSIGLMNDDVSSARTRSLALDPPRSLLPLLDPPLASQSAVIVLGKLF